MAFSSGLGVTARLDLVPVAGAVARNDQVLFSESNTRFVAEVSPQQQDDFEKTLEGCPLACVGRVEATPEFIVYGLRKEPCVRAFIHELKESWQKPLRW
jgi:phosphoribosylformylglycinamidine synthase